MKSKCEMRNHFELVDVDLCESIDLIRFDKKLQDNTRYVKF